MQLVRPPNLLTVPGDPVVGYLLAGWGGGFVGTWQMLPWFKLFAAAAASLFLYAFGLVLNDLTDVVEDRRDRPQRPLPSRAVSIRSARVLAVALVLGGVVCTFAVGMAAAMLGGLLVLAIGLYNLALKNHAVLGPLVMGSCRGLNLLLGASVLGIVGFRQWSVYLGASLLLGYVAGVTHLAADEALAIRKPVKYKLPVMIVAAGSLALMGFRATASLRWTDGVALALMLITLWRMNRICARMRGRPIPPVVQTAVGELIGLLLLIQASLAASVGGVGLIVAAVALLLYPLFGLLARRFYAS